MTQTRADLEDPRPVEHPPTDQPVTCQVCGARQRPDRPILCHACGEPVLVLGWAP
ncbi:MAG TPA: hypothetical protein VFN71_14950 [Methylomirabilota bacterium]|nr:hypothetical protein [Methylomirabilota bacterium]